MKNKIILASILMIVAGAFGVARLTGTPVASPSTITDLTQLSTVFGAQADYYLKIDTIAGESSDEKHKGEIELNSFSWGATNPGIKVTSTGGGGGVGKASFADFSVVKLVDKASPVLMLAAATGKHYKSAVLAVRKAGSNDPQDYFVITLSDVLVSSYQVGGSSGTPPTETISLNFAKIEMQYTPQSPDGRTATPIKSGWDIKMNKGI